MQFVMYKKMINKYRKKDHFGLMCAFVAPSHIQHQCSSRLHYKLLSGESEPVLGQPHHGNATKFSTGFNVSDLKYPSALIKMTHDCDLTDRHFGTVTLTFSKGEGERWGEVSNIKSCRGKKKKPFYLILTYCVEFLSYGELS